MTGNSSTDLKDAVAHAKKLQPVADEIEQLQTQLAAKLDAYHKAALPLWTVFSERLSYTRADAEKKTTKRSVISFSPFGTTVDDTQRRSPATASPLRADGIVVSSDGPTVKFTVGLLPFMAARVMRTARGSSSTASTVEHTRETMFPA